MNLITTLQSFLVKTLLLVGFTCFYTFLSGQSQYSFVSDRQFKSPADLIGYSFCPNEIGYSDGSKMDLDRGEICLSVGTNYLTITGDEFGGAYSINAIKAESYGYFMALVDAQDPSKQGELKFHLNKYRGLDVMVFKASDKGEQIVFFQALMSESRWNKETNYFTDKNEYELATPDEIWGDTIRPFHQLGGGKQYRIQMKDSIAWSFRVDTVDAGKKQKLRYLARFQMLIVDENEESSMYSEEYEIKNIQLRQSKDPRDADRRYQVEYQSKSAPGGAILLYLNDKKKLSMIEMGDRRFLIRGY